MRLIDADELKRNILKWMPKDQSDMDSTIPPLENLTVSMVMEIDEAPTVDAVPVVRCRDCKWCNMGECEHKLGLIWANDENYCSLGERKDGDHNG